MNVEYIVIADTVQQAEKIVLELRDTNMSYVNRFTVVINTTNNTNTVLNISNNKIR